MANKNKRIRFLILESILLLLVIITIFIYFNLNKTNKTCYINNYEMEMIQKENILRQNKIIIKSYSNIDNEINVTKETYFKKIKELEDKILTGESDKKIAYLTFDDGPYYNTYKVLDILDKYNVKATFFTTSINGEYCYDNKSEYCLSLYQEYLKRGHTIANHTYTHGIFKGLYSSTEAFLYAVDMQHDHIYNQTNGYVANILRFPGGSPTAGSLKNSIIEGLRTRGYGWVDWSANDGDGGGLYTYEQAWYKLQSSIDQNIEVILFHDYNGITTDLLPEFIEYLRNNGYILLPLFYESNTINK